MSDHENMPPPSPWQPENDKLHLAVIGKLGEEVSELAKIIFRCTIQGVDGKDPETGKPNLEALQEEIADVMAMNWIAIKHFKFDRFAVQRRVDRKIKHKLEWHKLINR